MKLKIELKIKITVVDVDICRSAKVQKCITGFKKIELRNASYRDLNKNIKKEL